MEEKNDIDPVSFNITLDIHSEIFNEIIKNNYLKYFRIIIPIDLILDLNLQKDYYNAFDKMNKLNTNYSSLYIKYDENELDNELSIIKGLKSLFSYIFPTESEKLGINTLFNSLNINFNKIKNLECSFRNNYNNNINKEYFYKTVLPYFNTNNLLYLDLNDFDPNDSIDIINDFVSLRSLYLYDFQFKKIFTLKIPNIRKIV